jgi:hypothetical protein
MKRSVSVTEVKRPDVNLSLTDTFMTILGSDKHHHSIGFWKGAAVAERLADGQVLRLTVSERDGYNNFIYNHINNKEIN